MFPSVRGKLMSDSTVSKLLRDHSMQTTPHGLRSAFRDWAAECSNEPREIAEYALAHVEGSAAELAYRRTDYFDRRRKLMEDWACYLDSHQGIAGFYLMPPSSVDLAGGSFWLDLQLGRWKR